jgi:hypothetical protein
MKLARLAAMRRMLAWLVLFAPLWSSAASPTNGCWVHAFAQVNYRAPMTTYIGPRHERAFFDAGSLIVGPNARVEGFDGNGYRKETLDLGPGVRVPDLSAINFQRRVDSFQVLCTSTD